MQKTTMKRDLQEKKTCEKRRTSEMIQVLDLVVTRQEQVLRRPVLSLPICE